MNSYTDAQRGCNRQIISTKFDLRVEKFDPRPPPRTPISYLRGIPVEDSGFIMKWFYNHKFSTILQVPKNNKGYQLLSLQHPFLRANVANTKR